MPDIAELSYTVNTTAIAEANQLLVQHTNIAGQVAKQVTATNQALTGAGGAAKLTAFQIQNLSYQMNDLAVGLASGQSPFRLIMQQGAQIAQLFGPGVGINAALKSVGSSLMTFLTNPLTLAVAGFAIAGQAAQLFFDLVFSGSSRLETAYAKQEEALKTIKRLYDEAKDSVVGLTEAEMAEIQFRTQRATSALSEELQNQLLRTTRVQLSSLASTFEESFGPGFGKAFEPFAASVERFRALVEQGKGDVIDFRREIEAIANTDPGNEKWKSIVDWILKSTDAAALTAQKIREMSGALGSATQEAKGFASIMQSIAQNIPNLALGLRIQGIQAQMEEARRQILGGSFSPGDQGRLLAELKVTGDAAIESVLGVTKAVRDFTQAGKEAANSPLEKSIQRVTDQAANLKQQIEEAAKITTIPAEKVAAMLAAVDAAAQQQIAGLRTGAGINAANRAANASANAWQTQLDQIEKQTAALKAEAESYGQSTYEINRNKVVTDLLTEAKQNNVALTDQVIAKINQEADAYARAAVELEKVKAGQEATNALAQSLYDAVKGADSFADSIDRLGKAITDMVLQASFLGTGPFSGVFGTQGNKGILEWLIGPAFQSGGTAFAGMGLGGSGTGALYHLGGVVDPYIGRRARMPAGPVQSFHTGTDEVAAVLRVGERVSRAGHGDSGGRVPNVNVKIYGAPAGSQPEVRSQQGDNGEPEILVMLDKGLRSLINNRSRGIQAFEKSYGLSRQVVRR